ncbi:hypothetical protein [Enterococcus faecium]|nr:hypothetical protein [Enterococcus faecium]MCM6897951.1 hypothetical protein [Enterococcus faecium]MCM6908976.1 hypothetical protein [Enterococcus faecium]MCM6927589.1 hypothetical protein [Enterococcus faecium]MCM6935480.1 hypothetical protein [Enterococcus faecium]
MISDSITTRTPNLLRVGWAFFYLLRLQARGLVSNCFLVVVSMIQPMID